MFIAPGILKLSRSLGAAYNSSPNSTLRSSGARRLIKPQGYKHRAPPEQFAAKLSPKRLCLKNPKTFLEAKPAESATWSTLLNPQPPI
jgi:hypothetical protein